MYITDLLISIAHQVLYQSDLLLHNEEQ